MRFAPILRAMKQLRMQAIAATFAALTVGSIAAQEDQPKRPPAPIKVEMKKFDKALDAVVEFLGDPKGDAPMDKVVAAQMALLEAKKHAPRATTRQPEGDQAAYVTDYRIMMNKTIRAVLDLEDALLKKDWKAAGKIATELNGMKKAGHKKFKPRRRRRGKTGK